MESYSTDTIGSTKLVCSILKERFPENQIKIEYNHDSEKYKISLCECEKDQDKLKNTKELLNIPVKMDMKVIYGDTDSIFIKMAFGRNDFKKNRYDTFKIATICGNKLTNEIFKRKPIEMEFEKVFQPFVLLTKKRYIGKKFEDLGDPLKLKSTVAAGVALTRRDYCGMVKKCYKSIIDCIVESESDAISKSIQIFKKYIDDICDYNIDIDDLTLSSMLSKEYKTRPVHVVLAEKLKERKEEVVVGTRIPYIFIESNNKMLKKSELGEDPDYAKKNGLKYNRAAYLDQLTKPIFGFLKVILMENEDVMEELIEYVNQKFIDIGLRGTLKIKDFKILE